jgi:hypothetical protein
VHPQIAFENGVDSMHFRYTHRAPLNPVLLSYEARDSEFHSRVGFKSVKTNDIALSLSAIVAGNGIAFSIFEGSYHYRHVFAVTPVNDHVSDMFYSIWYPRKPGDTGDMPEQLRQHVHKEFLHTLEEDLLIWRTQRYVDRPILADADREPYLTLRNWQKRFYDLPPTQSPREKAVG